MLGKRKQIFSDISKLSSIFQSKKMMGYKKLSKRMNIVIWKENGF